MSAGFYRPNLKLKVFIVRALHRHIILPTHFFSCHEQIMLIYLAIFLLLYSYFCWKTTRVFATQTNYLPAYVTILKKALFAHPHNYTRLAFSDLPYIECFRKLSFFFCQCGSKTWLIGQGWFNSVNVASDSNHDHDLAYWAITNPQQWCSVMPIWDITSDTCNYMVMATVYANVTMERDREAEGKKMDDNRERDLSPPDVFTEAVCRWWDVCTALKESSSDRRRHKEVNLQHEALHFCLPQKTHKQCW